MGQKTIIDVVSEPVSLTEARAHLRLDVYDSPATHPDDPIIESLVTAAREWCEAYTGRSFALRTVELTFDEFPCNGLRFLSLGMPPLYAVQFVRYLDELGVEQTFTAWYLDTHQVPARVQLDPGESWPATEAQRVNAVRVRIQTGYVPADESPTGEPLPKTLRQAMLLLVGHWYENREAVIVGAIPAMLELTVHAMLTPYRLYTGYST